MWLFNVNTSVYIVKLFYTTLVQNAVEFMKLSKKLCILVSIMHIKVAMATDILEV